jgi:hypothetical protein
MSPPNLASVSVFAEALILCCLDKGFNQRLNAKATPPDGAWVVSVDAVQKPEIYKFVLPCRPGEIEHRWNDLSA